MRSMVRWTAKFSSRVVSAGLRRAMLRASSRASASISSRKASSTSAVPFLPLRRLGVLVERAFEDGLAWRRSPAISSQRVGVFACR